MVRLSRDSALNMGAKVADTPTRFVDSGGESAVKVFDVAQKVIKFFTGHCKEKEREVYVLQGVVKRLTELCDHLQEKNHELQDALAYVVVLSLALHQRIDDRDPPLSLSLSLSLSLTPFLFVTHNHALRPPSAVILVTSFPQPFLYALPFPLLLFSFPRAFFYFISLSLSLPLSFSV